MWAEQVYRIDIPSGDRLPTDGAVGDGAPSATFLAGRENRLPLAALEQLLTGTDLLPSPEWGNPVILVGPAGCGKSMLIQGIVRRWSKDLGTEAVGYFTAVDFAREWAAATSLGELAAFRAQLAGLQLFVLEDLHKLPSRVSLQAELRNLLDTLRDRGITVLCTSQTNPAIQTELEEGLRDRLLEGLVVPFHQPGLAARVELLRQAAVEADLAIDQRQLRTLADSADSVPQLLRSLKEWELAGRLGRPVRDPRSLLSPKQIIAVVARYFGLTQATLRGPTRRKSAVFARSVAAYLIRTLTDTSFAQIGVALGNRDHSTIMHATETIRESLVTDHPAQHAVEELRRILLAV
jgi:chromosomal replication initiator protein